MRVIREWGSFILAAAAMLGSGAALFVDRSSQAQHAPLVERLVKVETRADGIDKRLDEIREDTKEILKELRGGRQ